MTLSEILSQSRHFPTLLRDLIRSPAFRNSALLVLPYASLLVGLDIATRYGCLLYTSPSPRD